jgi:transposase
MNTKSQLETPVVCVGLDWADREHALCLIAPAQEPVSETLLHTPEAIAHWVAGLRERFPGHRLLIALEQSRGALIAALAGHEGLELYPLNPSQLSSYRKAVCPSGAKHDPGDARLLAEFLRHRHPQLRPWQPDAAHTRRLAELGELRRKLVDERKRLVLKLTSSLKLYFPQALSLLGRDLHSEVMLDLLRRWPTLAQLQRVHPQTLRRFLAEHGFTNRDRQTQLIQSVRAAVPLTKDAALIEPRAQYVQGLVQQIRDLNRTLAGFDDELHKLTARHPDEPLFRALPGAGHALVPRLIAAFGSDRDRYHTAEEVQCYSGIAPVTKQSGQSRYVQKRLACPKFLRQTFHEFADQARKWSPWSRAFYRMKRAAGLKHHAAVRALAYKWIRIIFRLWKTNTVYSEAHYLQQLRAKHSPIVQFLETRESS